MRAQYSKKIAPLLIAGVLWYVLSFPLARYLTRYLPGDEIRTLLFGVGFFLWGFGFYYWALAKGRSPACFFLGIVPPVGLLVMVLLKDKHKDAPPEGTNEAEPLKSCPHCGASYREGDYRPDAPVMLCSQCQEVLPR